MKIKNGCALVCLFLSQHALGENNVALYGIVGGVVQYVNTGKGDTPAVGSSGQWGSRIGIKGSEDIWGGRRVGLALEEA